VAVATSLSLVVGILLVFRGIRTATRGLIAAPWTPASLSLLPGKVRVPPPWDMTLIGALMNKTCYRRI
jgi:hypothetical protein